MKEIEQKSVLLKVINVQTLESGLSAEKRFPVEGGSIGSGMNDDWRLVDRNGDIKANHCEITLIDGAYCLRDGCGETYINGAFMPMGKGRLAKIQHKDEFQLGDYVVRVSMLTQQDEIIEATELDKMFDSKTDDLISGEEYLLPNRAEGNEPVENFDPLTALDALLADTQQRNVLTADQVEKQTDISVDLVNGNSSEQENTETAQTLPSDGEGQLNSPMSLKRILGFGAPRKSQAPVEQPEVTSGNITNNNADLDGNHHLSEGLKMDDNVLDLLEEEVAKSMGTPSTTPAVVPKASNHLLTGPMLNGLGLPQLDGYDAGEMHALSEEIGESLQACIKGILELHQQVNASRFGVMNRNLQPIEDNPLRLGLDYEETFKTMYDTNKSMVHLSAPVAIEESLKHIRDHNDAVQQATSDALSQILAAFSPQVLMRRFNSYKRSSDASQESSEAWAWKMYCSYYEELTSNRQKGFEKLFWEIFEQAYDKKIRDKQLEF